jgi:hemolysin activation/secretion protein
MKFVIKRSNIVMSTMAACAVNIAYGAGIDAGALQQDLQKQIDNNQVVQPPEPLIKKTPSTVTPKKNQTLIQVNGYRVVGMTLITQEQAQEVLKPFINRKLTLEQINEAANAVVDLYQRIGRIAQAVVPPQDIKDGIIEIKIIEGKVGSVIIEPVVEGDPPRLSKSVTAKYIAYTNAEGSLVDLDGLERSISLINEIPGVRAEGTLEPGTADGTTNIRLKVDEMPMLTGRADLSNYGAPSTGWAQGVASLSLNDLAGIGDSGTVDIIGSVGSIYAQARYYIPATYDGLRVGVGASGLNYRSVPSFSPINSSGVSLGTNGNANTFGFYSTYALERTSRSNKTISLSLENKNYFNYISGVEFSNYTIYSAALGMQGNQFIGDASLLWSATATLGNLNMNNTTQLANDQSGAQTAGGYGKFSWYAMFNQPLPVKKTNLLASFSGQVTNKNLNSAEQFYLGGPYGVRAYPVAQGGGAQGALLTLEVNHTYENDLQLGVFFDMGGVQQYKQTFANWQGLTKANNTYALYSTGVTAKYEYKKFLIQGALAFRLGQNPLYNSSGAQLNVDNAYNPVQLWVKGSYYF